MALASVLLVEDDVFTRGALAAALISSNFEIKGQVAKATEALAAASKFSIDVAIIDLDLGPGANGLDIAYALRNVNPNIGIIILTSYSDPRVATLDSPPLPKGAKFLTKSSFSSIEPLVKIILQVKQTPIYGGTTSKPPRVLLTENQLAVLKAVALGLTTKEIASHLSVSGKSVEGTITRLYIALGLTKSKSINPRVQLARAYFELAGKKPPGV